MEIIWLLLLLAATTLYVRLTFPEMIKARQYGDLMINFVILALSLSTIPCFIFRRPWPDLAMLLSKLLFIPVEYIYRPWL